MSYSAVVLADNPAGYWRLGDSGATAADASGNGRDGTLSGGITTGAAGALAGDADTGMTFDGSTGVIVLGNLAAFQSSSGTLEAWIKTTASDGGPHQILDKHDAYAMYRDGNALSAFNWGAGGTPPAVGTINDDAWHHVVFTYQSGVATGSQFYVDGQPVGSAFTYTIGDQANGLCIGSNGLGSQFFSGSIDEVAFYPTALSADRILAHYNAAFSQTFDASALGSSTSTAAAAATIVPPVGELLDLWWEFSERPNFWDRNPYHGEAKAVALLAAEAAPEDFDAWWQANMADFWNRNPYHAEVRRDAEAALAGIAELLG
jgi:Concanavalin A-like lectin/glucanases superfamily